MRSPDQIDLAICALEATRLARHTYASSGKAAAQLSQIIETLVDCDNGNGQYGGLCKNVADAISKAFLNRPLDS